MSGIGKGPSAEEAIERLFRAKGLGRVLSTIEPVSGGLMHRMFKVTAESGKEGSFWSRLRKTIFG